MFSPFPLALAGAAAMIPAPAAAPPTGLGTWTNPRHTIAVRTAPCGTGQLCGAIVWAAPAAQADARDAGIAKLIGVELLQNYRPAGPGSWKGRVYVPDMGRTFSSRITQNGANELVISGCLIGNLFCRSQSWRRLR